MPVSHAPVPSRALDATAGQDRVPGLLEALAQVADPRRRRGRRFTLAFTLAIAVVCVLAGARSFREIGDQAADLPQEMLAALGGVPCPLRRKIPVPSEKRIRTLLQDLDGDALDVVIGGWLRSLAAAGNPARPQGGRGARRDRRQVAARRRRRAGQAVLRAAARPRRDHRPDTGSPTKPTRPPRSRPCSTMSTSPGRSSPPTPPTPPATPRSTSRARGGRTTC